MSQPLWQERAAKWMCKEAERRWNAWSEVQRGMQDVGFTDRGNVALNSCQSNFTPFFWKIVAQMKLHPGTLWLF